MEEKPRAYVRPKRMTGGKTYGVVLPPEDVKALEDLLSYHANLTGVTLSAAGIIRTAVRRYKEQLENELASACLADDKGAQFEALRQTERKKTLDANFLTIESPWRIRAFAEMDAQAKKEVDELKAAIKEAGITTEEQFRAFMGMKQKGGEQV